MAHWARFCSVILITGAGGMFGGVLRASGIGKALADSMADLGIPCFTGLFLGSFGFAYCARFCDCCPDYRCRVDGNQPLRRQVSAIGRLLAWYWRRRQVPLVAATLTTQASGLSAVCWIWMCRRP